MRTHADPRASRACSVSASVEPFDRPTEPLILAAVDLDRRATGVIVHAANLAALCLGRLVLVHVVDYAGADVPDAPFVQRPGRVRERMVRHARASLLGMAASLDLPTDWIEILVETGPVAETLAGVADALKPRYCAVGQARLGPLSPTAGLGEALKVRANCDLLAVADEGEGVWRRMLAGTRRWLGERRGAAGSPRSASRQASAGP